MHIVVAVLTGIVLASLLSFGVVKVVSSSSQDPITKPLYNYGTR